MTDKSTDRRKSEFSIRTSPMAWAFFAITGAALILAAIFNFTMAGHSNALIAEQARRKAIAERTASKAKYQKHRNTMLPSFPTTGSIQWIKVYPHDAITNELIITDQTGNGLNKVIEIVDRNGNVHIANLYLQANGTASVMLPATIYSLSLTEGEQWQHGASFREKMQRHMISDVDLVRSYNLSLKYLVNPSNRR